MRAFLSGFLVASGLWGALAFLYLRGSLDFLFSDEEASPVASAAAPVDPETVGPPTKGKRRGLKRPRLQRRPPANAGADVPRNGESAGSGSTTIGDDLGWDKQRSVDMAAGEAQLTGTQIDAGFDSVMGRIRRCLILVESDGELTGKLLFGMRVGSDGKPRAVNLSGPSVVISGESGSCLRGAAQNIRFPAFDGPDMLFKYPITLQ